MIKEFERRIEEKANPSKAKELQRFFKTGPGQYGEGDKFLGINVPEQRKIAREFSNLGIDDIQVLLNSKIHEKRLIALLILIEKYRELENSLSRIKSKNNSDFIRYKKASEQDKKQIFDFYLKNIKNINNWNLVDLSAPNIVGSYLLDKNRDILYELANSSNLWGKRIAIISTFAFIRNNEFSDSLRISEILLNDSHDLIHKAVGWMLREIGKKDINVLEDFLSKHYKNMPRIMLRYAIEKFDEDKRKKWLNGEV